MRKVTLIFVIISFLFALGLVIDVLRSTTARSSLENDVERIVTEAAPFLPYEPSKSIAILQKLAPEINVQLVEGTPKLLANNHVVRVKAVRTVPLYTMRLLGRPEARYTEIKDGIVEVDGAGIVGVFDSRRVHLAMEIRTGLDYQTLFLVRKGGSFKPALGEEYIQYFIPDRTGAKLYRAGEMMKLQPNPPPIANYLNYKNGALLPLLVAVLKPQTNIIDGFCEFVVVEVKGEDMVGYFVERYLDEKLVDNPPATYYGLFATGDKTIRVE